MSPAFVALVRKERLFLVSFGLLLLTLEGVDFSSSFEAFYGFGLRNETRGLGLHVLAALAGLLLGLREELTRTQEFLRQRPLAPTTSLLARGLPGALLIFLTPLAAGGLVYLHRVIFAGGGVGVRPDLWFTLLAHGCAGTCTFASAFLVGTLPLSWLARTLALFILLVGQLTLQSWLGGALSRPAWILVLLAWIVLLFQVARTTANLRRDLDCPPEAALTRFPLAALTLAAILFGTLATAGWQKLASSELAEARPWIGWTQDGRLVRCSWVGKPGSLAIVDGAGHPTGEELDDDQPRVPPPRHTLHRIKFLPERAVTWFHLPGNGVSVRYLVVEPEAARWIEFEPGSARAKEVPLAGLQPDRPRTFELFTSGGMAQDHFIFAPGEQLWRLRDDGAPRIERAELPGAARPLGTTHFFGTGEDWKLGRALDTTDGAFFYRDGQWVRPDPGLYRQPRLVGEVVDHDPFTPLQRVTGPGGATLDVSHPLDTPGKKLLAGCMGLSSVLRPLPLALVSAKVDYERVADEQLDEFLVLFDPVLGGGYAWLVVLNALFHAWLAWLVSRELARRGLEPARRRRWALAYLAAGIWIAAWCAALETRRAWKKSRSGPAPVPLVRESLGAA